MSTVTSTTNTAKLFRSHLVDGTILPNCVGTHIKNSSVFQQFLTGATDNATDLGKFDKLGTLRIDTPPELLKHLVCGSAPRSLLTKENVIVRTYRGEPSLYLDRSKIEVPEPVSSFSIIYNMSAVEADPQVEEATVDHMKKNGYTHMWVTTRADAVEYRAPLAPYRFAANMAGGNAAYLEIPQELKELAKRYMPLMLKDGVQILRYQEFENSAAAEFLDRICSHSDSSAILIQDGEEEKTLHRMAADIYNYAAKWVTVA